MYFTRLNLVPHTCSSKKQPQETSLQLAATKNSHRKPRCNLQQQKTAAGNLSATCSSKKQPQECSLQPAAAKSSRSKRPCILQQQKTVAGKLAATCSTKKQENTSLHFFQNEVGGRCRNSRAVGSFVVMESLSYQEASRK